MAHANVLWIKKLDYPKGWGIRSNTHDYRQMFFITDGAGRMEVGQGQVFLRPDSCVLIRPNEPHRMPCIESGCLQMYDVKFVISDPFLAQELSKLPHCIQNEQEQSLRLLSKIRREWKSARHIGEENSCYETQFANLYFEELLYLILRGQSTEQEILSPHSLDLPEQEYPGISGKIVEYLELHYAEKFSLENLSANLSYNRNYLCNVFKNTTGYTIQNYLNTIRIQKAIDQICHSHKPLMEISANVGFKDIHHFNRIYKAVTGQTPGFTRAQVREGISSDLVEHGEFLYRYKADSSTEA